MYAEVLGSENSTRASAPSTDPEASVGNTGGLASDPVGRIILAAVVAAVALLLPTLFGVWAVYH